MKLLMTAALTLGLTAATMAQVPSYVPTNGLVGWWPFNGNANDESGNGNNGTVNGANLTIDRNNNSNSAYTFDGTNDFIEVSDNASLRLMNTDFTINAWVLASNNDGNHIWYKGQSAGNNYPKYIYQWNNNLYAFHINGPGLNNGLTYNSNTTQIINWQMATIVKQGNSISFYVNSILSGNSNFNNLVQNTIGHNVRIGGAEPNGGGWWNGKLDDIGIWNRALTACEIAALYNGQTPTQPTTACYQTATFNTTTCQWDVTGTQPAQPTIACYQTATFNNTTCQWDVTGTQSTISNPTSQTININTNAQFVVGSSDPSATFQWQTDIGFGFQNLNSVGQYSGTTTNTLTVSNVTMSNNNQPFRCIISSGSCTDTSNVAVLTVKINVGINETTQENLFTIYPNPAQSVINVKADSKIIGAVYAIYDNIGKVVLTGTINAENTVVELGNLSGGVYLFSVGENTRQTFKIIKE